MQQSYHFAKSCSIWILLSLVGLPVILLSLISWQCQSCLKTWPIHRCFLCQTEFSICLSSFTVLGTSSLVTLSSMPIFSILLHIYILKASNLLSVWVNSSPPKNPSSSLHVCSRVDMQPFLDPLLCSHPLVEWGRWQGLHDKGRLYLPCRIYAHGVSTPIKSTPAGASSSWGWI